MRLLRLDLTDVGPFDTLTVDLSGRLVGVVGPNGSGKSTILSSIYYAVTGDLGRLNRKKAANVLRSQSSTPNVRLTFLPDDAATDPSVVVRQLPTGTKDGSRKLTYKDRVWANSADIDDRFATWTGLSKKALGDVVFVAQGKLDEVVTAPAAQRADVLHRAFGVDAATKIADSCRDHLNGLPTPPDPAAVATLRAQAAEAMAQADEAERVLAATPAPDPEAEATARDTISSYQRAEAARSAHVRAKAALDAVLTNVPTGPEVPRPDPEFVIQANRILAEWRRHHGRVSKRDAARTRVAAACRQLHNLIVVPDPGPPPEPTVEHTELASRRYALEAVLECQNGDSCPVCAGPLTPDLADLTKARADLDRLTVLDREYGAATRRYTTSRTQYDSFLGQQTAASAALSQAEADRSAADQDLEESGLPIIPETELRRGVEDANWAASAWAAYDRALGDHNDRRWKAEQALDRAPPAPETSPVAFAAAEATLRHEADRRVEYSAARATATALRQAADAHLNSLAKADAAADAAAHTALWRDRVERVRSAFGRDAAPADAAASCLEAISGDLNVRLGHLAARFRVRVQPDGELLVEYRDGTRTKTITPDLLSGGEGCVLGLAWRLALLDKYAPKVGLLCLDEPTTGLDAERVGALKSALEAWRPHGSDRQFVIVTHERKLLSAFDAVVDLGAG